MRTRSASIAVLAVVAIVFALVGEVGASGGGALAPCQTAHPSGTPIAMTFAQTGWTGTTYVATVTVIPTFGGKTYDPITVSPGELTALTQPIGSQMEAGCAIFNNTELAAKILAAIGMGGSQINLTACSFLGGASPDCTLKAPLGGINTPLGWQAGSVTGYIGR